MKLIYPFEIKVKDDEKYINVVFADENSSLFKHFNAFELYVQIEKYIEEKTASYVILSGCDSLISYRKMRFVKQLLITNKFFYYFDVYIVSDCDEEYLEKNEIEYYKKIIKLNEYGKEYC
jgi:hypothetical protein